MDFLIPANSKKSMLIFGIFTTFDLILVSIGFVITLLLLIIVGPNGLGIAIICLLPMLISAFLVIPIANYHNVLTLIKEVINFFYNRRNYKWKGWCYKDEFK